MGTTTRRPDARETAGVQIGWIVSESSKLSQVYSQPPHVPPACSCRSLAAKLEEKQFDKPEATKLYRQIVEEYPTRPLRESGEDSFGRVGESAYFILHRGVPSDDRGCSSYLEEIEERHGEIPRDRDVVLYYS